MRDCIRIYLVIIIALKFGQKKCVKNEHDIDYTLIKSVFVFTFWILFSFANDNHFASNISTHQGVHC